MLETITPVLASEFYISVGKSRKDMQFKNKKFTWQQLVDRLQKTQRTFETFDQYMAMDKDQQDAIKDIGGFVGGTIKDGRRKATNVQNRTILTLDADYIVDLDSFLLNIELYVGAAAVFYSTHKHSPKTPRGRLVIPLSRPCLPDEYQAIARSIANKLGIDQFDDSTYQPHRIMYWPSTAKDADFVFEHYEGDLLNVENELAGYPDWKDSSYWYESSRAKAELKKTADKQGDPLEKPGMVGIFNRTFSITEAIESFLSHVYEIAHDGKRWTYLEGTTSGGLVVYDNDLFAYSNHATDPVGGKLVNAFDLVRIHLFGDKDRDSDEGTRINHLPSFRAMEEFANNNEAVKKVLMVERLDQAKVEFEQHYDFGDTKEMDSEWMTQLTTHQKTGAILPTAKNIKTILLNDPYLKNAMAFNEFNYRYVVLRDLPWRKAEVGSAWQDTDDSCLRNYLETIYSINGVTKITDALNEAFNINKFHPVRNYLNALTWDGVERIETILIDYLGAEDNEYVRTVTRKTMLGAVARIFHPGIKFDTMLVLVGKQGVGKSTLFARLGGKWFSDSLTGVHGKEAYEQLIGKWILEVAELAAIKRSEVESTRNFFSKTSDSFRAAYARHSADYPRQNVFVGTTNEDHFLKDVAGNRRFWPVTIGKHDATLNVFKHLTDEAVGRLWAEAVERYKTEKDLHLDDRLSVMAEEAQEAHFDSSPRFGIVEEFLNQKIPQNWNKIEPRERYFWLQDLKNANEGTLLRYRVCPIEIWCECFGGDPKNFPKTDQYDLNNIMKKMPGWTISNTGGGRAFFSKYGKQTCYTRVLTEEDW